MSQLKNIMLVEDDEDIRQIAELILTDLGGFNLTLCSSGHEAWEKAKTADPQLILLDYMMPGLDGPNTLVGLRQQGINAPVIFMTARAQTHEIEQYMKLGALGCISKPFKAETLSNEVVRIWQSRQPTS